MDRLASAQPAGDTEAAGGDPPAAGEVRAREGRWGMHIRLALYLWGQGTSKGQIGSKRVTRGVAQASVHPGT